MCLCSAQPCTCEDAKTQAAWEMVGYLNECQQAFAKQRELRRQVPAYPPPCDFGEGE